MVDVIVILTVTDGELVRDGETDRVGEGSLVEEAETDSEPLDSSDSVFDGVCERDRDSDVVTSSEALMVRVLVWLGESLSVADGVMVTVRDADGSEDRLDEIVSSRVGLSAESVRVPDNDAVSVGVCDGVSTSVGDGDADHVSVKLGERVMVNVGVTDSDR